MEHTIERLAQDYQAAVEGAAYRLAPDGGFLEISGEGRVDFIQRQSTNDMALLTPGRTLTTALTDPAARILDVLEIFEKGGETLGAITLPGNGAKTAALLKGKIFFNDKVTVEDKSADFAQIEVHGPEAVEALAALGFAENPAIGETVEGKTGSVSMRAVGRAGLTAETGYLLLVPQAGLEEVVLALKDSGAVELSHETYEILRVEAALPAAGHELTADYTPLESGLAAAISDSKGCYTGQEVIARQITYDKITKSLVSLTTEERVTPGDEVRAEGKKIGQITSSAVSPKFGPMALAILKRPYNQEGVAVSIERNGKSIEGTVKTVK
jgi:folate-binding protein YgfZ